MIKICFIINNLKLGGAERQFVELIRGLDKKKYDVTVYLYAENEPMFYDELLDIDNIHIFREKLQSRFIIFKIIKAILRIRLFLRLNRFDLVQTTLVMNGALVRVAAFGLENYKNRIVTSLRKNFDNYLMHEKLIESILINNSYSISNTKFSAGKFNEYLKGYFNSKIFYIYNGFDTTRFIKKKYESISPKVIGSVGRMSLEKNQIQILRALVCFGKELTLYIIGDAGFEKDKLENFAQNHLPGFDIKIISHVSDIENYYCQFDIFILSSLYEGCPNVLFEAMLSGCMCIISESANTDAFVIDGVNGLVYDNSDNGLAECIKNAYQIYPTDQGEKIIENGYKYARDNFSISKMIKQYDQLFNKIIM